MNLLVTGGAGFIGSNLIRSIIEKPEIQKLVNLDCLTYAGRLENLTDIQTDARYFFEKVDLRDKDLVLRVVRQHEITHVIHLAAESHVDRSIMAPADFIHTNIVGTFHLLEACRQAWSESTDSMTKCRFLHVSTDEVFGSLGATGSFTENSHYAPNSPYSASKAASDMLVRASYQTYGLPTVITNCSNNYGPYQHPEKLIPVIIQSLLERHQIPLYGNGSNVRDWLHVADHCDALWKVVTGGQNGETYCIGGGSEHTNLELAQRICDITDELRPDLGGHSQNLISFVKDRPGHDLRYSIDHLKLSQATGWKPKRSFAVGLRETVVWYLHHQNWITTITDK